ncbi:MAG TPA: Smr/MutS family protein [bacterium]|nr:Smr/MutS family protein [bacterium]
MSAPDRLLDTHAETLAGLEWPRLLEALAARLATASGHAHLAALAPLPKLGAVRHALALNAELRALREKHGPLGFSGVHALEGLLERAERQGRLEAEELAAVLSTQRAALQLRADLQSAGESPGLRELAEALHPLRELVERLGASLTATGALNERAYPELARLREQIAHRREALHRKLDGLLRNARLSDAFQDQIYTLRGRRYVLPVKADFKGHLPGIVHDVSASGATLFMEPQAVVEDTNAVALTERLLELEQDRILRQLSWAVGEAAPQLQANLDWIGRVDLLNAQAALAEAYQGTVPQVEAEGVLDLKGVAHPLMLLEEASAAPGGRTGPAGATADEGPPRAVRNDVRLGGETRCMVISGANTGGKTVLLKAVGLAALLVRHGMPIPALAGSRCDWFAEVWADIGDLQSLDTSLSTFSAQIRFLTELLPRVGPGCLVLLDEMLTGTEPAQGAALGSAVLEALLVQGVTTLVTTHFGELKQLAAEHAGIVNASMAFDAERLRPTYRLQMGLPGASFALHIARRYGLAETIVARAETSLADRPAALDALLVQVHEQGRRLEEAAERQRERDARLHQAEAQLAQARADVGAREREVHRRERGAISAELRAARRRIGAVIRELQQAKSLPTVSRVRDRLAELEREHEAAEPSPAPAAAEAGTLEPGAAVWLPSLQRGGVLEALLDEGRRASVRLGALTMELDRAEVLPAAAGPKEGPGEGRRRGARRVAPGAREVEPGGAGAEGAPGEAPRVTETDIPFALSTEENTLDVRGLRLEEALEQAEAFFDRCTMKHVSPVMVIHGHGTGRLKAGLREAWHGSPYVAAFRPGGAHEGRDGVTIVALDL